MGDSEFQVPLRPKTLDRPHASSHSPLVSDRFMPTLSSMGESDDSFREMNLYRMHIEREHALRAHEQNQAATAHYQRAAIESANVAIRSLILINGAAVIALLAFVGSLESGADAATINAAALVAPISWFAFGVGFAAVTAVLAYLVNMLDSDISRSYQETWENPYFEEQPRTRRLRPWRLGFHILAMVCALASLGSFGMGVWTVTEAIGQLGI